MKKYMVIGDPIQHSMSPIMHNDLFQYYGIDAHYDLFHIKRGMLQDGVKKLRAMNVDGFNVTVPHKTDIMPFLDRLDPLSEAIGAVNTVVNENGQLVGYNTDGSGFLRSLESSLPDLKNRKVLIIGAGGAARAIYFTLAHYGISTIDIVNRTADKGIKLKADCPYKVNTEILDFSSAEKRIEVYSLLIQTTSIGMSPEIDKVPLSVDRIKEEAFVSDIIYNPVETKFLQMAKQKGAMVQNGIDMFVYQGALAFEKWQGIFPDVERMRKNVLKQLGGK